MVTFKDSRTVYFDVDDTLLEWRQCSEYDAGAVKVEHKGYELYKKEIAAHTDELRNQKMSGNTVIVWSAGGSEWAAAAVYALKLDKYVDVCLTKPDFYYDDKDVQDWFPEKRFYYEEK